VIINFHHLARIALRLTECLLLLAGDCRINERRLIAIETEGIVVDGRKPTLCNNPVLAA
jgi:hypothetical protein